MKEKIFAVVLCLCWRLRIFISKIQFNSQAGS